MLAARDCRCGAVHSLPGRPIIYRGFVCRARSRPGFLPETRQYLAESTFVLVLQYLLGSDFVVVSLVSESRQYLGGRAFARPAFIEPVLQGLRGSPACHLLFSFLSMVVVVMVGIIVIAEGKHGTLEQHT